MPVEPIADPPKPCNHLLHFFLGFLTCGFWWVVWMILAVMAEQERKEYLQWYSQARYHYEVALFEWKQRNGIVP